MGGLSINGVGFRSIGDFPRFIFRKFIFFSTVIILDQIRIFLKNVEICRDGESGKIFYMKIFFYPNFSLSVAKPK